MMNERIQELAEQAGLLYPQFGPTVDTRHQRKKRENIEKFAELIVRECADIADRRPNVLINQTVGGWIKQHFGVES
jgi:hypothetical protein